MKKEIYYNLNTLWNNYTTWLKDRVGFNKRRYKNLIKHLNHTEFIWVLDDDRNRMEDGLYIREDFLMKMNVDKDTFIDVPCTVLEVLVALTIRMYDEYVGEPGEEDQNIVFWELLSNLGLDDLTDNSWDQDMYDVLVDDWMKRNFDEFGVGSIFPLYDYRTSKPKTLSSIEDQRKISIWSQMQYYISSKYGG